MKKIIILGAYGQIARIVRQRLLKETDVQLTLYLRNASRLKDVDLKREKVVEGDVNDFETLSKAIVGQDIVYANLGGRFEPMAKNIVKAMQTDKVQRLIYVTGLGLYHEVPGEFGRWIEKSLGSVIMDDTRRAAAIIEASTLDYTIIRAAYMNNNSKINYETTQKGEPFKGTIVSRVSIADYIVKVIQNPEIDQRSSVGIDQPGTDGDRPY